MSDDPILSALTRFEAGQTALHGDVTKLRADFLEELVAARNVLMERMNRLQSRIDQLREECFLAFAQSETVRRHSENTRRIPRSG